MRATATTRPVVHEINAPCLSRTENEAGVPSAHRLTDARSQYRKCPVVRSVPASTSTTSTSPSTNVTCLLPAEPTPVSPDTGVQLFADERCHPRRWQASNPTVRVGRWLCTGQPKSATTYSLDPTPSAALRACRNRCTSASSGGPNSASSSATNAARFA